jgi:hypothetical protein
MFLVGSASAALPPGWISEDVGDPAPGSASEIGGTWTISGNGNDIWGNSDNFHYVYLYLEGDGEMSARVVDNGSGSNAWAKCGVMIRQDNTGPSQYAYMAITGGDGSGACFQWRDNPGGGAGWPGEHASNVTPPRWVRLVREGDSFTAYLSTDGITWEASPIDPHTVNMTGTVLIGLAVTSHAAGDIRTFTFDNVSYVGNIEGQLKSSDPTPVDGALYPDTWVSLSWTAGYTAVSHDVYFGESLADVEAGTGDTFRGNQALTNFVAGFTGYPYPDGLVPGTTYYWRIDEVEADGTTKQTGDVWSFIVPPKTAYDPAPADNAAFVEAEGTTLTWTPGYLAKLHTVYFGDDYDTVANAAGAPFLGIASYSTGSLELEKTYYWRVDEFDGVTTHTGDVWSFKTAKVGGGLRAEYYHWTGAFPPPEPFQVFVTSEIVPEVNWNWGDGGSPHALVNVDDFACRFTGEVEAAFTETYTFYMTTDDGQRLWIDGQPVIDMWVQQGMTEYDGTIDLVAGQKYSIELWMYEHGSGAGCELRWSSPHTSKQIIPQAALSPPVRAMSPSPTNGATGAKMTPILKWKAGIFAASHEVYFGTDADAVKNADKSSPEYKGTKALGDESYDPGKLAWFTEYFWRVDEVNAINPDSPWVGNLWSFTTGDFLVVDDFEDYNAGDNQIWVSWYDGLGFGAPGTADFFAGNDTGAAVGDETTASYTEETIVHGGRQSMPLSYDNNKQGYSKYSETELTLAAPRDWTEEGVAELSLWFRGYPASVGSFVEGPVGTYTMTGSGADIWSVNGVEADEFHFAYKILTGAGSIVAKVESLQNTNVWAKAGVMIRESLDPDSKHAFACVTPENGVASQGRPDTGAASFNNAQGGVTAPHWVKLERDLSGNFTVSHSTNGSAWEQVTGATPQNIQMSSNVYIGLALTSHDAALTCQAVFSNVTITGTVGPQWTNQDIGIASNAAEPLYVALSNSAGAPAVVVHDDPAAATIDAWTEWVIPLQAFADQGVVLTDVDRIAIGLGTRGNITIPGGSGKMFFDDIRLYQPEPEPEPELEPEPEP